MSLNNAHEVIRYAADAGIKLMPQNENLVIDAPKGKISVEFRECLLKHKQQILRVLSCQGFNRGELQYFAGEDWQDIKDNQEAIEALAKLISDSRLRHEGIIPPSYTAKAYCHGCGNVFLPPTLASVNPICGCPWCFDRMQGVVIPTFH